MPSLRKCIATLIWSGIVVAGTGSGDDDTENETQGNTTLAAPIVAVASEHFEGVDGTWSTFEIHVGTPAQTVRVLPITSWQETWVVYGAAAGVCNTSLGVSANCADLRGEFFDSASSSSWVSISQDQLGLDVAMGYSGVGQYGKDTVGLGYTGGTSLTNQIVSEIVSDTWWFGQLGLGFQPTNFSGFGNPQASFSDTLWSNGTISSMSWAYTAGAVYRLKGVFGSLIFGGYDASKFTSNGVIFNMTSDNLRDIVVSIQSITSTTASGNTTLMSTPELAFIDSSVPELWLPVTVCQEFEKAFGLTLDPASELYLINASTHNNLLALNPNFTITLTNELSGGATVDIVLPYAAFDLNVSAPLLPNASSLYFPIRQADDSSLYTLGRTFLQEAYVVTHYNSRTFNVSQAVFSEDATSTVIAIPADIWTSSSSANSTSTSTANSSSKKHFSGGVIAGIVLGCLLGTACVGLVAALLIIRHRRRTLKESPDRPSTPDNAVEIDPGKRLEHPDSSAYTAQASAYRSELSGNDAKIEIQGNPIMHPQELEAEVPILPNNKPSEAVNGPSDSSRDTRGTNVSSLSPIVESGQTPMAEMGPIDRGLGGRYTQEEDDLVSPNTDTLPSMMERQRGDDRASTPVSDWSPSTPVERRGSRFQERW